VILPVHRGGGELLDGILQGQVDIVTLLQITGQLYDARDSGVIVTTDVVTITPVTG